MSYATAWMTFHWVVRACMVLSFVMLMRSAWKDQLPSALISGALLALFIGVYPALRFSGYGEYVRGLIEGNLPLDMTSEIGTKRLIAAILWTIVLTVPGPFVAVAIQVFFRTMRRIREEKSA
ncbi:MAG: hypothetical protein K1Y02_04730 [Candidatus Hydrogenedentes bacterium]|nr:hypothetical protein [Candidatus Hydrogenedentota bacterium]